MHSRTPDTLERKQGIQWNRNTCTGDLKAEVNLELYTIGASRTNSWYNIFVKINTEVIKYFNLSLIFRCNLLTSSKHDFHEIHISLVSVRVSSESFSPMNLNYGIIP